MTINRICCLVFALLLWISADAQDKRISISADNEPIAAVMKKIEQATGYVFFYNDNVIDKDRRVTLKSSDEAVGTVLERLFASTGTAFSIIDGNIVLSEKEEKAPVKTLSGGAAPLQKVSGRILDPDGLPLIGVAVWSLSDKSITSLTDLDGNFSLETNPGDRLAVSIIGFLQESIAVSGKTTGLTLTLKPDIKMLDEVVVVGYGVQKRSDITGAISSVDSEKAQSLPTTNVAEMLRGAAPGLQVNLGSAEPGGSSSILIRGRRSLSGGNDPLYVVDGVPMASIDDVNANDIASIEVLKDASSQSIYGARAANGVILVTTKRGVEGKVKVNYSGYAAVQTIDRNFEFYNGEEWAAFRREAYYNTNGQINDEDCFSGLMLDALNSGKSINWEDVMIRPAVQHKHDIGVQAGNEKTKFSLGLGYYAQDGMVQNSGFEKLSGRLNIDQKLGKYVTLGANISFSRAWKTTADGSFSSFITTPPLGQIYEEDGVTLRKDVTEAGESHYNPLWNIKNSAHESTIDRMLINMFADWKIVKGLSYRLNASMSIRNVNSNNFQGVDHTTGMNTQGNADITESSYGDYLLENIFNYTKDFNKNHHFDATLMQSVNLIKWRSLGISGTGFPGDGLKWGAIASANEYGKPDYQSSRRAMVSFLGRARYNLMQRYLFTLSMRIDGSSVFGANNKYGFFPSGAFAWRIDKEEFMAGSRDWLNNLKLRLSYGQVGNQGVSPYMTLGLTDAYYTEFGTKPAVGFLPGGTLNNPDLKWETSSSANIGIDFGFLKDRINGSIELYDTRTSDLLVARSLNQALGYSNQMVNLGMVENKGVEIALNTVPVSMKKFSWNLNLTWAKNDNRIKKINGELDENGKPKNDINNKWFIGEPVNVYYDYDFDGIWQLDDDILNSHMPKAMPGAIRVRDVDGNGTVTENDRVIMRRDPDWIGSISTGIYLYGFDLTADLYVSYGGCLYNPYLTSFNQGGDLSGKRNGIRRNYWTTNNPSNEAPAPSMSQTPAYISALGYQDASYVRLRNVTLGYNFPQKLISRAKMSSLRLYFSFTNPWTWTKVLGYGPEQNPGSYPEPRTGLFGVKVSF